MADWREFWGCYGKLVIESGVPEKQRYWVVHRAENYVRWLGRSRVAAQLPEDVTRYLTWVGQNGKLSGFQFGQVVLALELLFTKMIKRCNWADSFNWDYWKESAGETYDRDHGAAAVDARLGVDTGKAWLSETERRRVEDHFGVLLSEMSDKLKIGHYRVGTITTYRRWVERFLGKSGMDVAGGGVCGELVAEFMRYVAIERQLSASSQNQALDAIAFFCREVLQKPLQGDVAVSRAKRRSLMATVLSEGEVSRLLEAMQVSLQSGKLHLMAIRVSSETETYVSGIALCLPHQTIALEAKKVA